jgi:hypothetical protein
MVGGMTVAEAHMIKLCLFLTSLLCLSLLFVEPSPAHPACEDGYSLCVPGCATKESPERCMQRCQQAMERCEKSGVFHMPIGFLLNRTRLEDWSRAEGEIPVKKQRKKGGS